ncbi:LysR substrate binding domain-containing protein [Belnapia rosea]|uniref:LysR substrate binding domain-containing protein n=1 Tax=Belnapia rosea TaxID=938405 RepID=A0A1G7B110_9PROT|nr:LysR substrate binding domain-containing protein [Belnapia rosea]
MLAGRPDSWVRRALRDALGQEALGIEVAAEADTVAIAKRLVLAGLGPMVDVAAMVRAEILEGRLRAVPLGALAITRLLVMPRGREPSPTAVAAAGLLRDCAREMLASGLWLGARAPTTSAVPDARRR